MLIFMKWWNNRKASGWIYGRFLELDLRIEVMGELRGETNFLGGV